MTTSWNGETAVAGDVLPLYNIATLQTFVNDTNSNFFSMGSDSNFETIDLARSSDGTVKPISMVVRQVNTDNPSSVYYLNEGDLGPLAASNEEIKRWLRTVWYFTLGFSFQVQYPTHIDVSDECYEWEFLQKYDFTDRGLILVTLSIDRTVCKDLQGRFVDNNENSLRWVSITAIILSLISFVATWIYFYGMAEHLDKLQHAYDKRLEGQF